MNIIIRAIVGGLAGITLGSLVEIFWWDSNIEHGVRIPMLGVGIGFVSGVAFSIVVGMKELRGKTKHVVFGVLFGTGVGIVVGSLFGPIMAFWQNEPIFGGKIEAGYRFVGIIFGTPIGGIVGGILGFLRRSDESS